MASSYWEDIFLQKVALYFLPCISFISYFPSAHFSQFIANSQEKSLTRYFFQNGRALKSHKQDIKWAGIAVCPMLSQERTLSKYWLVDWLIWCWGPAFHSLSRCAEKPQTWCSPFKWSVSLSPKYRWQHLPLTHSPEISRNWWAHVYEPFWASQKKPGHPQKALWSGSIYTCNSGQQFPGTILGNWSTKHAHEQQCTRGGSYIMDFWPAMNNTLLKV